MTFATSPGDTASLAWPIYPTDVLRLSIGIEDAGDIIADVEQAFGKTQAAGFGPER